MTAFAISLVKGQKIAVVMSPRLGDSLLTMIVVSNLWHNGFHVDVFGDYIFALKNWFSWAHIEPLPKAEQLKSVLSSYDLVIYADKDDIRGNVLDWHPQVMVLEDSPLFRERVPMVDMLADICREELKLDKVERINHITPPKCLTHRKFLQRVVIHPSSHQVLKNWPPQRFVKLAQLLTIKNYQPEFVVSPSELKDWSWLQARGLALAVFPSLNEMACWLYESGWFIGNDSGVGHLASNLGVPTITLGIRPGILKRWRPAWAPGLILLPPAWLITRPLKERYWKYLISVKRVLWAFDQLVKSQAAV